MSDLGTDVEALEKIQEEVLARIGDEDNFVRAVFSGRRRNFQPDYERVDVRLVRIKDEFKWQIISTKADQVLTKNLTFIQFKNLNLVASGYANFVIESRSERFEVRIGKKGQVFAKKSRINLLPTYEHDRKKTRFLEEDDAFLVAVGISDKSGHIKPSMRDKYLQVEEFLRILDKSVNSKNSFTNSIRLIDLGCGHAYLTFAAFRYFQLRERQVSLLGVDVKDDTRIRNEKIAVLLGITDSVRFIDSSIAELPSQEVDIAIALHACDTATDDALAWAVRGSAQIILAAPCCHHDLHRQIHATPEPLIQVFDHGILKVRQIDILTDALRAALLELVGYKAEVFEFISGDHTARNLMIRAIRNTSWNPAGENEIRKHREYRHTCTIWGVEPALAARLELGELQAND